MLHSDSFLSQSPPSGDKRRKGAKKNSLRFIASSILIGLMLVACSGSSTEPGNAERGKTLFNAPVQTDRGAIEPCSACHAIVEGQKSRTGLGTNFHDMGARAGGMVKGQSAEQYLRTSIVDPDAFLAGNFQDGLMSREYSKLLTPQQIEDLVAYMLTLK
jgi:cytochrome c